MFQSLHLQRGGGRTGQQRQHPADKCQTPGQARQQQHRQVDRRNQQIKESPAPESENRFNQHLTGASELAAEADSCQLERLLPGALLTAEQALLIELAGGAAAQLAAGGLGDALRRDQQQVVRRVAKQLNRQGVDPVAQLGQSLGVGFPGLGQHDQPLAAALSIVTAEHGDVAFAHPRKLGDRFFQFLRVDVASGDDDQVFAATGDEDLAGADIAQIAGVEPVAVKQFGGRFRVAEITAAGRWAAELDSPFLPLR